jgi:kynurenine formamidase
MTDGQGSARTKEELGALFEDVKNWGRWGDADELGTLNFMTADKTRAAAALVETGRMISLALPLAVTPDLDNPRPVAHHMVYAGDSGRLACTDYLGMECHGRAITHIDALCHVFFEGKMYNGHSTDRVTSQGAMVNAIGSIASGIATRGILLDVPRALDEPWLEPGFAVLPEHLAKAERDAGLSVSEGDAVLIRTGRFRRKREVGSWNPDKIGLAGLDAACMRWFHERRISLLGSDCTSDVLPRTIEGNYAPIHQLALAAMGLPLLDNLDLESLGDECTAGKRWAFLLMVAPLVIPNGTGSPVNPIAIF